MTKTTKNGSTDFHAEVKAHTAPKIVDSFNDDAGEENYVLSNGNTTLASRYNAIWNPCKGTINPKGKGDRIDAPQRIY